VCRFYAHVVDGMAEELRQENLRLQAAVNQMLENEEIQKQRVSEYLTKTFAERDSLKEECNRLQNEAENLLKELQLLKPRGTISGNTNGTDSPSISRPLDRSASQSSLTASRKNSGEQKK
jgi:hypothetical protein